jgi:hypothetical protein
VSFGPGLGLQPALFYVIPRRFGVVAQTAVTRCQAATVYCLVTADDVYDSNGGLDRRGRTSPSVTADFEVVRRIGDDVEPKSEFASGDRSADFVCGHARREGLRKTGTQHGVLDWIDRHHTAGMRRPSSSARVDLPPQEGRS